MCFLFSLRYYLLEILWAVMCTGKVLVKTRQGKVLPSSWQTKGLDLEINFILVYLEFKLIFMCPFLIQKCFLE